MCDRDERFRSLPGRQTLQIDNPVFGDDILDVCSRIRDNRAIVKRRQDSALELALLVREGRRQADKALPAL